VGAKSAQAEAAFRLLLWLSDERTSPQVSAASPATTLFRQSNLRSPGQWVEKPVSAAAAAQYGDATESALRHEQWLGALRLPGRAEYLAALDEAVAAAVRGEKSPLEALIAADAKWRKITERLGLERQKAAYRHSLGLE
jgi:multiple sugar transport system substrate-binding protein